MPLPFCPDEDFPLHAEILAGAQTDCLEGALKLTHLTTDGPTLNFDLLVHTASFFLSLISPGRINSSTEVEFQ